MSLAAFLVIAAMPSDPVAIAIRSWNLPATDQTVAALRAEWGLDQPLWHRYCDWLIRFIGGDWGHSFRTGEPVLAEFLRRLPLSLAIGMAALALALAMAVPFGFAAALHPRGIADRASRLLAIGAQALPSAWLGLILIWVLGVHFRLIRPFAQDAGSFALAIVLVGLHTTAVLARVYRRDMLHATTQPFFRTALAKGRSRSAALWHHAHPHALYALVSAFRAEAAWAIGSTATIEVLFGLPGISQFLVESIAARDYAVLQAYVMVVALWLLVLNGAAEAVLHHLDPRTR